MGRIDLISIFSFWITVHSANLSQPCGIRFAGDHAVVADLAGNVGILDSQNELVSVIPVAGILGEKGHRHPHDAILLPNGDLVVGTWNPGRISYWRRLGEKELIGVEDEDDFDYGEHGNTKSKSQSAATLDDLEEEVVEF